MRRDNLIRMFVLDSIADDYENLTTIESHVHELCDRSGLLATETEIVKALVDLIESRLVGVYILSSGPARLMIGVPALESMSNYYFWPTEEGRQLQQSAYPGWPLDESGELRKDWVLPTK